jgi:hypothetical protein
MYLQMLTKGPKYSGEQVYTALCYTTKQCVCMRVVGAQSLKISTVSVHCKASTVHAHLRYTSYHLHRQHQQYYQR